MKKAYWCLTLLLLSVSASTWSRAPDTSVNTGLHRYLQGDWCLNKEVYEDEITYSGEIWSFRDDNTYQINGSPKPFSIEAEKIKMQGLATLNVLEITEDTLVAKVYSTYYFTKPRCSDDTLEALKITKLNNAIFLDQLDTVKSLIDEGIDISKPDLRSGLKSTPLMIAVKHNRLEIVKLLLAKKPDLSVSNYAGKTVQHFAEKPSTSPEIRELITYATENAHN